MPAGKVWAWISKTVCRTLHSTALLGLLMRNPIVSGSTDLWQHVSMYYSMPGEVPATGGRTQNYRQAGLRKQFGERPSQMQRPGVYRRKQPFLFFSSPVWWHIMQQTETSESINRAAVQEWGEKTGVKDGAWPLQGQTEVLLNRSCYSSRIRSQHFIFIAVMFNQLPWELGHPLLLLLLLLPSLHLHPSLGASITFPDTKRSSLRRKPCC